MEKNILTKELLLKSVSEWNEVRKANPDFKPDLREADLRGAVLCEANLFNADLRQSQLRNADLRRTNLGKADLSGANLSMADLRGAVLSRANLFEAILRRADLRNAVLSEAVLGGANLLEASLSGADLRGANLFEADLRRAALRISDLSGAIVGYTSFGAVDLSSVIGLDTISHRGPSTIGIETLYASKGIIPDVFLQGCGVPDTFIEYVRSLIGKAIDYYSCFISHSTTDKNFVDRFYADLQAKGVRCWYAPHDMEGGEYVDSQIDDAIKIHEKLLLVLSDSSINSDWVKREIIKAVNREDKEEKQVLFPISLVEYTTLESWEFVDSKGRDLAERIRKYYIPIFKGWENDNHIYTTEFSKLLKAFQDRGSIT